MATILALHGPNLNTLGTREPDVYGKTTLNDLNDMLKTQCEAKGHHFLCFQSNSESAIIDQIHEIRNNHVDFMVFNPAAYTHTSIAIRDAILAVDIPFIECHLSNVFKREAFRHHSYFSDIAEGVICGLGIKSYTLALDAAIDRLEQ